MSESDLVSLGIRVTAELTRWLVRSAAGNGRTLSQEVDARLWEEIAREEVIRTMKLQPQRDGERYERI